MTGFEPQNYGIGNDRSTNRATTIALDDVLPDCTYTIYLAKVGRLVPDILHSKKCFVTFLH